MSRESSPSPTRVPWRSRPLQAILASTAILPLGVPMLSPVLPAIRDHFGIGDPGASLVIVAYFLPAMLFSPFLGILIDRVGRRRVMTITLSIWAATGFAIALGPGFRTVLLLRLVQGASRIRAFPAGRLPGSRAVTPHSRLPSHPDQSSARGRSRRTQLGLLCPMLGR